LARLRLFLIAVAIGVAATLTWQSYNDAVRETIAPAAALKAISADLNAVWQSVERVANNVATSQEQMTRSVDQLAAHVATGQQQITREITALQTVEQQVLEKISMGQASATTAKPVLRPSRGSTALTPARNP
jgi:hypothetical protein